MPHIFVEKTDISLPNKEINGFKYNFLVKFRDVYKIGVKYKDNEFLLTIKEKENILIKADKITRIAFIDIIKKAILNYANYLNSKVLSSNVIIKEKKKKASKFLKDIEYFFDFNKEVSVEIGFGSGRHLLYRAKENPNELFIGLEIYYPAIEQVLRQIELQKIENILIINYDARLFLEFLKSNSVNKIYVHFPVPWDKKPHRRIYSKEFVDEAIRVLKKGGSLELRTDSINYFKYSLDIVTNLKKAKIIIDINKELEIVSKYEQRWKRLNKDIYDIILVNEIVSKEKNIEYDFNFYGKIDLNNIEFNPIVENDFFVHFKNIFKGDVILVEVSFGSFNKPENKYLILEGDKLRYFQSKPIPSSSNLKAHKLINRILNVN